MVRRIEKLRFKDYLGALHSHGNKPLNSAVEQRLSGANRKDSRTFSAPDPLCEGVPSDIELSAPATPITLVVDVPFDLDTLGVVATDQKTMLVSRVPITVQLRDQTRPRLSVERVRMGLGPVDPAGLGILTFRVRAVCSETPAEVLVSVHVRELP